MSFVREPQYTTYTNNLADSLDSLPFTRLPPAGWQPEASDNMRLIVSSNIQTNGDYRKYMTTKVDIIREKNVREYEKTL